MNAGVTVAYQSWIPRLLSGTLTNHRRLSGTTYEVMPYHRVEMCSDSQAIEISSLPEGAAHLTTHVG